MLGDNRNPDRATSDLRADRANRAELLDRLNRTGTADVAIIGGGIHGAAAARIAAAMGLSTVLLEKSDYAAATSSRSSKMVHGGLRYLEMFDFAQVFEGIRAREELFEIAAHIAHPRPFLIPVSRGDWYFRLKLKIGLTLYDWFVLNEKRRHCWFGSRAAEALMATAFRVPTMGCYQYWDGIVDDCRLVLENVLDARRHGALCLNYVSARSIEATGSGLAEIGWQDERSAAAGMLAARAVLNCSGPWVPEVENSAVNFPEGERPPAIRLSRGVHLLFARRWSGPAVFLPLPEKARYYWVWPHPAGAMVGTTEQETDCAEGDPQPQAEEIDTVLARLARDLPGSGLDRSSLFYAFAGIRSLPWRPKPGAEANVARLSRRHIWHRRGPLYSLYGGKLTTAGPTVCEALAEVLVQLNRKGDPGRAWSRPLPGAERLREAASEFSAYAQARGLSQLLTERLIGLYGSRVCALMSEEALAPAGEAAVAGELALALQSDQAETVEDVIRRRLELEYLPGHGEDALPALRKALAACNRYDDEAYNAETAAYRDRLRQLARAMGK